MKKCLMTTLMLLCFVNIAFSGLDKVDVDALPAADFAVCLECHEDYASFLNSEMVTQGKERKFIESTFAHLDPEFGDKNCSGCHVQSCLDCHTDKAKPATEACIRCHNGANMGMDYTGMGIREDHSRYQRGPEHDGENYMAMLPDVHFEKGLQCADCHSMKSFTDKSLIKQCTDCHSYSKNVIDHEISGHAKVACVSCHAAWAPNEYGTFYVRFTNSDKLKDYFRSVKQLNDEYVKSSFMRINAPFALGKNAEGIYVPIRPRVIFYTHNYDDRPRGRENAMLSNRWESFTPHTVRRETALCESCHSDRRRYLLETDEGRYFSLRQDGLPFNSFWNSGAFSMTGGSFVSEAEFSALSERSKAYVKYYLRKLEQLKGVVK